MQRKQQETLKVSLMELINDNSTWVLVLDKRRIRSVGALVLTVASLSFWVYLCYQYNLFVSEALICSAIIAGALFFRASDKNRYLNNEQNL